MIQNKIKHHQFKFIFVILGAIVCCFTLMLILSSCNVSENTYKVDSNNAKILGRTYAAEDETMWLVNSGSGVEFEFSGTKCSVELVPDKVKSDNGLNARLGVIVDDKYEKDIYLNEDEASAAPSKTVDVIDAIFPRNCNVKLIKISESLNNTCGIKNITTKGQISPSAKKDLSLEFVGDSISVGYGIEAKDSSETATSYNTNVYKAFAYKTANKLNADFSIVGCNGTGVLSGYTKDPSKISDPIMGKFYDKLGYSNSMFYDGGKELIPQNTLWNFSAQKFDIVVINLCSNDMTYIGKDQTRMGQFVSIYQELLKQIRTNNPNACIVCTYGTISDIMKTPIELAMQNYISQNSDNKVVSFAFDVQNKDADGTGVGVHPSEKTSEKDANKLVDFIKNNILK